MLKKIWITTLAITLSACSANSAKVETSTSPVDGKTTTYITGSSFSNSLIYPVKKNSGHYGILIEGGAIIDKEVARINISSMSKSGYDSIFFKADGEKYDVKLPNGTSFDVTDLGVDASTSMFLSCSDITKISQSSEVFMRVTYRTGFVDYFVSDPVYPSADGFEMIKKIASYCL